MAKVNENLETVNDVIYALENLDNPEYLLEQGIDSEDICLIKELRESLYQQLEEKKGEIEGYIKYKLKERLEDKILLTGIVTMVKSLAARGKIIENKISKTDTWLDFLCQKIGITELKIPEAELKYKEGSSMIVTSEGVKLLPDHLTKYVMNCEVEEKDVDDIVTMGYIPEKTHTGLVPVKQWYKAEMERIDKEIADIDTKRILGETPEEKLEYDKQREELLKSKEVFKDKVYIDDSKSLSIKQ